VGTGTYTFGGVPGSKGNREDLLDFITNISPRETPLLSSIETTEANDVTHEWLTDSLPATSTAGAGEGFEFASAALTARTRVKNWTQIFQLPVKVSNSQRAANVAGVDDEYKYQIMKNAAALIRNVERRIFSPSGSHKSATAEGGARLMKTLSDLISKRSSLRGSALNGVGSATASSTVITEKRFNNALQRAFENGGKPDVFHCNAAAARQVMAFTGYGNARRNIAAADRRLVAAVEVYESQFGIVEVILNRWIRMPSNHTAAISTGTYGQVYWLERSQIRLAVYRPFDHVPLAPNGDATRGYVMGEVTLEIGDPSSCYRAWGVKNIVLS